MKQVTLYASSSGGLKGKMHHVCAWRLTCSAASTCTRNCTSKWSCKYIEEGMRNEERNEGWRRGGEIVAWGTGQTSFRLGSQYFVSGMEREHNLLWHLRPANC